MTEDQLQAAIIECARLFGWRHYHTFNSRRSVSGFPDLVLLKVPRIIFAELKTATGKLTDDQREWLSDDWGMGLDDYAASDLSAEEEAILDDRVSRSLADFDTGAVGIRRVGRQLVITAEVRA